MSDSSYVTGLRRELASSIVQRDARKRAAVVAELKRASGGAGSPVETAAKRAAGRPKKVEE